MNMFDAYSARCAASVAAYMSEPVCKCGCGKASHLIGGCPRCTSCCDAHADYRFEQLAQKLTAAPEVALPVVMITEERRTA